MEIINLSNDVIKAARYKLISCEYQFTSREADILLMMRQGMTVEQIANILFRSKKTVYSHIDACQKKPKRMVFFESVAREKKAKIEKKKEFEDFRAYWGNSILGEAFA